MCAVLLYAIRTYNHNTLLYNQWKIAHPHFDYILVCIYKTLLYNHLLDSKAVKNQM